jgi:hypothetical protein
VATGTKVTEAQLGQFQPGHSTYQEVIGTLGPPNQSTLHSDGTREAIYLYTQMQLKPLNFVPILAAFSQGGTAETTTVTLLFDARGMLASFSAAQGQTTMGTGFLSGGRQ